MGWAGLAHTYSLSHDQCSLLGASSLKTSSQNWIRIRPESNCTLENVFLCHWLKATWRCLAGASPKLVVCLSTKYAITRQGKLALGQLPTKTGLTCAGEQVTVPLLGLFRLWWLHQTRWDDFASSLSALSRVRKPEIRTASQTLILS